MSSKIKFLTKISESERKCVLKNRTLTSVDRFNLDPNTVFVNYKHSIIGYFLLSSSVGKICIDRFEILPKYRRKGKGSSILKLIENLNIGKYIWLIPHNKEAIDFFESNGYDKVYYYQVEEINMFKQL